MIKNQYIDGEFLIIEYENGAIVKVLQSQEPSEAIPELPKNPILELQQENAKLREQIQLQDSAIMDLANMISQMSSGGAV